MEKHFINLIKTTLNSNFIGDDCAHLRDLEITVSQDSLIEDVHFIRSKITPWQLGWKTAMVNISDICASGAEPKYLTVALSLPKQTNQTFIRDFYAGLQSACQNIQIVGGDLTLSDKIYISATAIGTTNGRNISSRSNASVGQKIIVSGYHGSSAAGLKQLLNGTNTHPQFIKTHLEPIAQREFSKKIATTQKNKYAMMDTSDGLMDALSQIATASNVLMDINFENIPYDKNLEDFPSFKDLILFGGEDYQLIATADEVFDGATIIGEVKEGLGVKINNNLFTEASINNKIYKHFT